MAESRGIGRGGLRPGGERGRPKGSKNKWPGHTKLYHGLREHGLDFCSELVKLYWRSGEEHQVRIMLKLTEFLFPKRRPEDEEGRPEESAKEAALEFAKQISEMMSDPRKANR